MNFWLVRLEHRVHGILGADGEEQLEEMLEMRIEIGA